MADRTPIEWTDATWNPIVGCSVVSPGCTNCYAMRVAGARTKHTGKYVGLTRPSKAGPVWTGELRYWPKALLEPLKWRAPRRVFVNSMGDLFHEDMPEDTIDRVFAIMAMAPQHRYQILTKRAQRMRDYVLEKRRRAPEWVTISEAHAKILLPYEGGWPTYIWLGVSAERQDEADERIPHLLATPAAVRFVSLEPLLGPIKLTNLHAEPAAHGWPTAPGWSAIWKNNAIGRACLDWVIVGGESGPHARPMHPDWARSLRDQCAAAGVPYFFKQWGEHMPAELLDDGRPEPWRRHANSGKDYWTLDELSKPRADLDRVVHLRVGKRAAGRLLDGRTHDAMPEPRR